MAQLPKEAGGRAPAAKHNENREREGSGRPEPSTQPHTAHESVSVHP